MLGTGIIFLSVGVTKREQGSIGTVGHIGSVSSEHETNA